MNWYSVFYWITVADNIKLITGLLSIILALYMGVACMAALGAFDEDNFRDWERGSKRVFYIFSIAFFISIFSWMLVPSKRDALIIVAGGAVGNFITSDSSIKQIPAEVTMLLREKIRSEIKEIKNPLEEDTLANKSVEELKEIIKNKKP